MVSADKLEIKKKQPQNLLVISLLKANQHVNTQLPRTLPSLFLNQSCSV